MSLHYKHNEVQSVILLSPQQRYEYFIKKVGDNEMMYTLADDSGNFGISDLENAGLFPLWPAREFAELCKVNGWSNYSVKEVPLEYFNVTVVKLIDSENYLINVFPIAGRTGFIVDIDEFTRDINCELEKF